MGRTNATFRDLLRHTEREWGDYRRALRRRDREHFDRLFEHARDHADAAGTLNPTDPVPAILLSIVLAQERERAALEERNRELDAQVVELSDRVEELAGEVAALTERADRVADLEERAERLEAMLVALQARALEGATPPASYRRERAADGGDRRRDESLTGASTG